MTLQNAPAGTAPATSTASLARLVPVPAPPSWAWRRGALILAGAAQLAAAAVFAAAPVNRLAAVIAVPVLGAGTAGGIVHTGLFFLPALVMLVVASVKLWREQSRALAGG